MLQNNLKKINKFKQKTISAFMICLIVFISTGINPEKTSANSEEINKLNQQIEGKRSELEALDAEIAKQKSLVQNASGRANTLQNKIYELETTRKSLLTGIDQTEAQIKKAELTLSKLDIEIRDSEFLIDKNSSALAESIRKINILKSTSLVEKMLGYEKMSDFWNDFEQTEKVQKRLGYEVDTLQDLHEDLRNRQLSKIEEKGELSQYKVQLSSEKEAVESTKQTQSQILSKTKNEEAAYQKLLQETLAKKKAFEDELLEIESKLNLLIDPESYQKGRRGIFGWPAKNFVITQYYGSTSFSRSSGLYATNSHNGVDFGIPLGTQVLAVADGKVKSFGNTDAFPGCNSWGKWILLEHNNGLSTLYAHLSSTQVSIGQQVSRGQVIALSGSSGISTGPHLHLTTYVTQGVQVRNYRDVAPKAYGCGAYNVSIPMASPDAYLNPIDYLPQQ